MENKVSFNHEGVQFNDICTKTARGLSKVVKIYCKEVLNLKVGTSYDSFAGGNSLRITLKEDIDLSQEELWRYTDHLSDMFEYGTFDAMTDMAGYKPYSFQGVIISDTQNVDFGARFVNFVGFGK